MSRLCTKPVHFLLCLHKCFDETVLHGGAGAIRHRNVLLGPWEVCSRGREALWMEPILIYRAQVSEREREGRQRKRVGGWGHTQRSSHWVAGLFLWGTHWPLTCGMNRMSFDGVRRASTERKDRIKRGIEEKTRGGMPGERPVKEPSFIADVIA